MPAEAALTVHRTIHRPSASLVGRFAEVPTGNVADALGRRGALAAGIRPIGSRHRFAGPALTVRSAPNDNLAPWAALEHARPGDVLVIATGDWTGGSTVGDVYVGMARNRGVVAVVTDGLVRDLPGIEAVGIPVFARGLSPNSPWKNGPGEIGAAVSVGDVVIRSGDIVVGDQDGVVVVPSARAEEAAEALAGILAKEAAMERDVAGGREVPAWLAGALAEKGVRYID